MNVRNTAYWTATILVALAFASGGGAQVAGVEASTQGITALGYPVYFSTLLGVWKLLGAAVILAPRLPLVKEWAYAGIAFDLIAASYSHLSVGDPVGKAFVPIVILGIAATSWALRPADRVLAGVRGERAEAAEAAEVGFTTEQRR